MSTKLDLDQMSSFVGKQLEGKIPAKKTIQKKKTTKKAKVISPGEEILFQLVKQVFQDETMYKIQREAKVVENRRYRTDIAIYFLNSTEKFKGYCIEIDGWMHHGFSKVGFKRDREKDRLTLLSGFITVRFFASEILNTRKQHEIIDVLNQLKLS